MKNIHHLLKLNVKLSKNKSGKSDLVSLIFSTLIYGLIIGLVVMFFVNLVVNFETVGAEFELLVFLLFFVLAAKVIFGMIICLKVFFNDSQNEILARLPFSPIEIFISRFIYVFIMQLFFGFALLLPLLNIYGQMLSMPMSFYVAIPFVIILSNIVALLIATLISFPAAYIKTFLSNKFTLTLIVIAVGFTLGFYGYMLFVDGVIDISSSLDFRVNNQIIEAIARLSTVLTPNIYLTNILFSEYVFRSILNLFLIIAVFGLIVFLLVKFVYDNMLGKKIGSAKTYVGRKSKNKQNELNTSLLKREFITIFRNTSFLFQFFALLITTPLITYLTVRSSSAIAVDQIGDMTQNVIAFFVLALFSVIGSSFATNSISREGSSMFLLKILPLTPKSIVTSKLVLSLIANFLSLLISVLLLFILGYINIGYMLLILIYCFLFSIGNISYAIKLDLKDPQLQEEMGVAPSDRASVISISTGFILSIVVSFTLLLGVAWGYEILANILIAIVITLYATGGILFLYRNLNDNFKKIII